MKGDDKLIKWSKNYLMGIDKLDEEHKELFRISDQIYNKPELFTEQYLNW